MAKTEQILRLKLIEAFLRHRKEKGASFEEIAHYLEQKFADKDLEPELRFSHRTFDRDRKAIAEILGLEIEYSRKQNVYYISQEELENTHESVFDNLLLVQAYRQTKDHSDILLFEQRKSRGLHHLHGLVHAILNRKIISVRYFSFSLEKEKVAILQPYALKEFRYRWYLLALEQDTHGKPGTDLKAYSLDRISDLQIKNSGFNRQNFNLEEEYNNLFGIVSKNDHKLEEIILSFDAHQGQYIKSLPLHHSQEIVTDNDKELRIKVRLYPTYDFKQEILSHGQRVKVIAPATFRNEIKAEINRMLSYYN